MRTGDSECAGNPQRPPIAEVSSPAELTECSIRSVSVIEALQQSQGPRTAATLQTHSVWHRVLTALDVISAPAKPRSCGCGRTGRARRHRLADGAARTPAPGSSGLPGASPGPSVSSGLPQPPPAPQAPRDIHRPSRPLRLLPPPRPAPAPAPPSAAPPRPTATPGGGTRDWRLGHTGWTREHRGGLGHTGMGTARAHHAGLGHTALGRRSPFLQLPQG